MSGPDVEKSLNNIRRMLVELKNSGVAEHGSVDHITLAGKFAESEYWLYPCTFPETFCITALKAQMSGCIPVYFNYAALRETVFYGYACNDLFNIQAYSELVLKALTGDYQQQLLEFKWLEKKEYILKNYTWDAIADKWLE